MPQVPVTVYSTPNCVQCRQTKVVLQREGIVFTEVDLTEHPDKLEEFKAKGFVAAPIVTTDTKTWSGFKLNKIMSLVDYIRSMTRGDNK